MPRCPSCFTPMTRADELGIKSAACPNCYGTWIGNVMLQRQLKMDIEHARQTRRSDRPAPEQGSLTDLAEIVAASHTHEPLRCPQCEKAMTKERYHPMIPVQIDRCKFCASIWLDAGELPLLRRLHCEMMTSDDPEIQRRRHKMASVLASWDTQRIAPDDAQDAAVDGFDLLAYFLGQLKSPASGAGATSEGAARAD